MMEEETFWQILCAYLRCILWLLPMTFIWVFWVGHPHDWREVVFIILSASASLYFDERYYKKRRSRKP